MGKMHEDTFVYLAATVSFGLACVMGISYLTCIYGHEWPKVANNSGELIDKVWVGENGSLVSWDLRKKGSPSSYPKVSQFVMLPTKGP